MINKKILAVGAHSDDVEFGCYGTLIKHKKNGDDVVIVIMSKGDVRHSVTNEILRNESESMIEGKTSADMFGFELIQLNYKDSAVPFTMETISDLEKIIVENNIDTIYTHWGGDTHQDHINTLSATLSAGRMVDNVLCYEQIPVPRVTTKHPTINYYVDVSDSMDEKIDGCKCHKSQVEKYMKNGLDIVDGLISLAGYRGNQIGVKYAEAFNMLKMVNR